MTPKVRTSRFVEFFALVLALSSLTRAYPVPSFRLSNVLEASDVVVVARVLQVREIGTRVVSISGKDIVFREFAADAVIERNIKGQCEDHLSVHVTVNEALGYPSLNTGTQMLFLSRRSGGYVPASPYVPALPAVEDGTLLSHATPDNPIVARHLQGANRRVAQLVIDELGSVIASPAKTSEEKSYVLHISYGIPVQSSFDELLLKGLKTSREDIRYQIMLALVERNNVATLPIIRGLLLDNSIPDVYRHAFINAIGYHLRNPQALDELGRLMQSDDVAVRRASVMGMRHSHSAFAKPFLVTALSDTDQDVQYQAVCGLSEISGDKQWSASVREFRENPSKYVQHWRRWAGESGKHE